MSNFIGPPEYDFNKFVFIYDGEAVQVYVWWLRYKQVHGLGTQFFPVFLLKLDLLGTIDIRKAKNF